MPQEIDVLKIKDLIGKEIKTFHRGNIEIKSFIITEEGFKKQ